MLADLLSNIPLIGFLTTALETFIGAIGSENIDIALGVFGPLISIFISISGIMIALGKAEASDVFYRSLLIGGYVFFIQEYELITAGLFDFFSNAGLVAGGSSLDPDFLYDPSGILVKGFLLSIDLVLPDDLMDLFFILDNLCELLAAVLVWLCFGLIALTDFFFMVEYHIVTTLLLILFPFGILPSLSFLSESVLSTLFRLNVKIMTFSFVLSLTMELIEDEFVDKLSSSPTFEECLVGLLCIFTILYIVWKIPNLAANVITGSATLNAQGVSKATLSIVSRTFNAAVSKGISMIKK